MLNYLLFLISTLVIFNLNSTNFFMLKGGRMTFKNHEKQNSKILKVT